MCIYIDMDIDRYRYRYTYAYHLPARAPAPVFFFGERVNVNERDCRNTCQYERFFKNKKRKIEKNIKE